MSQFGAIRPDAQTAHNYWTVSRGDSERAFRAARSHSRRIRILRVALPVSVVLLLAVFALWTWLNPMRLLFKIPDVGGDLVISGTKITMQQPRVTGYTRDSRPYELTAKAAAQDLTRPDIVDLSDLRAKFQMTDTSTIEVVARSGQFNSKKELLELGSDTVVTSTSGYKVLIDKPVIDIKANTLTTEHPVRVEMSRGELTANSMQLTEAGALLRFEGVKMTVKPDDQTGAGAKPK
jgi:lipopolysaccharide export system protein LptC